MNPQHHVKEQDQEDDNNNNDDDEQLIPPSPLPPPLPIQFQLLYNWEVSAEHDALLKNKIRMFPTFKCDWHGTSIYRIIDHDLGHHAISAGQLWKACGLTLTEGLFLFKLTQDHYQVDFLLPHFPLCDVWVSVEKARHMVSILGVEVELQNLLASQLDEAFSTDTMARNELVHNWKIESIPNVVYSTRALLETPVSSSTDVSVLLGSRKIRTQISRVRQPGMVCKDRLENGLVRWAVYAYEAFHQQQQQQQFGEEGEEEFHDDEQVQRQGMGKYGKSVANAMWDVMQGLLYDLQTLALGGHSNNHATMTARVLSDSMVVGNMPLKREYLAQGTSLQNVYLASMVEKIHHEIQALGLLSASLIHNNNISKHHRAPSTTMTANNNNNNNNNSNNSTSDYHTPIPVAPTIMTTAGGGTGHVNVGVVDPQMMLHDRMDSLEQEIYRMKRKYKRRTDDMQSEFQELQQQILALEAWKIRSERARRSERIWILMISLSLFVGFWAIRAAVAVY